MLYRMQQADLCTSADQEEREKDTGTRIETQVAAGKSQEAKAAGKCKANPFEPIWRLFWAVEANVEELWKF